MSQKYNKQIFTLIKISWYYTVTLIGNIYVWTNIVSNWLDITMVSNSTYIDDAWFVDILWPRV